MCVYTRVIISPTPIITGVSRPRRRVNEIAFFVRARARSYTGARRIWLFCVRACASIVRTYIHVCVCVRLSLFRWAKSSVVVVVVSNLLVLYLFRSPIN